MTTQIPSLLHRYRDLAAIHASTNYADRKSVQRANKAADDMIALADEITQLGDDAIREFATLLDDGLTALWAAHHLLERIEVTGDLEGRALAVITNAAKGDGGEALAERMWLEGWWARAGR